MKERRLELAMEGQRWFDLVRLDKVEEVMNAVFAKDEGRPAQTYPSFAVVYITHSAGCDRSESEPGAESGLLMQGTN